MQQLESRMLALTETLKDSEPDKADRLRAALDLSGRQRVRGRMDQLLDLIRTGRFSEAERAQDELLADLNGVLEALSGSDDLLAKRRDERQKIEEYKRRVRTLLDEQLQHLYRTRQAAQRQEQPAEGATAVDKEVREMLKALEELQRQTEQKAAQLRQDMQKGNPKQPSQPGSKSLENATQKMQRAIERMQEQKSAEAAAEEEKAGGDLQEALDQLDEALKQVRQEEREETLAALDTRFRAMLERELRVRERVASVSQGRDSVETLVEAGEWHREALQECESTLRILVDEGTTVIIPELLRQLNLDMQEVAARLERTAELSVTGQRLDEIIAALQEILAVVDQQRSESKPEPRDPQNQQQNQQQQQRPLLPNSAELKLMRSTQVRLNERSRAASDDTANPDAGAALQALAQRQRQLAEMAQRMNDRK